MAYKQRPVSRIGQRARRHYIGEWMKARDPEMKPADLARETGIDKSTISRWINTGQMPQDDNMRRLAEFFQLDDPESLTRHPDDDWLTRFFHDRSEEERRRIRQMIDAAFPSKQA